MEKKVILISVDGMRPDGFEKCCHTFINELKKKAYYTMSGKTVFPPVTLPCHMSLFHSVSPDRHGITSNQYMSMVRPVDGLFEQIHKINGISAMYYGWEPLRDVSRPESLTFSEFIYAYAAESADTLLTDSALYRIQKDKPDFVFLYLVDTDDKGGHDNGWMSEEYFRRIRIAMDNIKRVVETCEQDYNIIITADHGGHARVHGEDVPEDMTIPMFYIGQDFERGKEFSGGSILDIAPTIAKIMGLSIPREWEGVSVLG